MTEFKCWKKTGERNGMKSYENKENGKITGVTRIINNPKGKPYSFNNDGNVSKNFKSKSEAIKFANKFMKEHDKC